MPAERRAVKLQGIHERQAYVLEKCKGKAVLDVGFSAYPHTNLQRASGRLLHDALMPAAATYCGADLQFDPALFPASRSAQYHQIDIEWPGSAVRQHLDQPYDVIVVSEVLEHLLNPGRAVDNLRQLMRPKTVMLVTAPNALGYPNVEASSEGCELVHSDHVCWYSPATLHRLLRRCELNVLELATYGPPNWTERHLVNWGAPHFARAPGIIALAERAT